MANLTYSEKIFIKFLIKKHKEKLIDFFTNNGWLEDSGFNKEINALNELIKKIGSD